MTNLSELISAEEDLSSKAAEGSRSIAELMIQQAGWETQSAAVLRQAAADTALVETTAGMGLLAAQDANARSRANLDFQHNDPNSLKDEQELRFVLNKRLADEKLDAIAAARSVSIFDNPLEYIVNSMELPGMIKDYNMTAVKANSALNTLNAVNSSLTTAAAANKATAQTLSVESIAASSRVAAAGFTLKANDAEYKALGALGAATKVVMAGNTEQVASLSRQYALLESEEGKARVREQMAVQRRKDVIFFKEHEDRAAAEEALNKRITDGMGALGMGKPDSTAVRLLKMETNTPAGKRRMEEILEAGARMAVFKQPVLGLSPGESFYAVAHTKGNFAGREYEPVLKEIKLAAEAVAKKGISISKENEFTAAVNEAMKGKINNWNADPDNSPIFKLPTLEKMSTVEAVTATEWYKKLLAPSLLAAKTSGGTAPSLPATALVDMTIEAVMSKKLSFQQASEGLAMYAKMGTIINSVNNSVVGVGPQKGYTVTMGSWPMSRPLDITKPERINALIASNLSLQMEDIGLRLPAMPTVGMPSIQTNNEKDAYNIMLQEGGSRSDYEAYQARRNP